MPGDPWAIAPSHARPIFQGRPVAGRVEREGAAPFANTLLKEVDDRDPFLIAVGVLALATATASAETPEPSAAEAPFLGAGLAPADVPEAAPVPPAAPQAALPPAPALGDPQPAVAESGDDPAVEEELEAESAELDEVRRAEENAALVPAGQPPGAAPAAAGSIALLPEIAPRPLAAAGRVRHPHRRERGGPRLRPLLPGPSRRASTS